MYIISGKYFAATREMQKLSFIAAGELLLSVYKGSAYFIYYILNGLSLILLFKSFSNLSLLSSSFLFPPANRAEKTPGCPLRESTQSPESSAIAGKFVCLDANLALTKAFSINVLKGSSQDSTPKYDCGIILIGRSERSALISANFF